MSTLTGAPLLLRQAVRRDRVLVPGWVAVLVVMTYASASATTALFGSSAERVRLATEINGQPGLLALYGPILDPDSAGELAMSKLTVLYALFSAGLYVAVVRRHTRVEEESGRAELVGGTVVGRDAPLAAAVMECAALAIGLGCLLALAGTAGGLPWAGSVWFGVVWAGTGVVATGVAAVACQVSASARTCSALAAGALAGAYTVRAVGDAVEGLGWLSWLSPLGWNTQLRAWSEPRWWVVALYLVTSAALVAVAQLMRSHRDLGAGLVTMRPGPVRSRLAGPWGLTLRLQRTSLLQWTVGVAAMGLAFGAMAPGFDDLLAGSGGEELIDRLGGSFIGALLSVTAILVTPFAISVIAGAYHDRAEGRTGLVLATSVSRARWFGATAGVALTGSAALLLVCALGLSIGYGAAGGSDAPSAVPAALGWIPAVGVVGGVALLGLAVGRPWLGWAFFVLSLTLTLVGELLELPVWLQDLSPYSAVPMYPIEPWRWPPLLVLTALAALLVSLAWFVFRAGDVE
ncbi:ABC transporter permease [Janibacter sp. LM]|uniref:ABC transporter permease n=1 Tax=Janibacter sp. LM TaxID=3144845 RepID=UPI0031F65699